MMDVLPTRASSASPVVQPPHRSCHHPLPRLCAHVRHPRRPAAQATPILLLGVIMIAAAVVTRCRP